MSGCCAAPVPGFYLTSRYDGDIPGWGGLARHDQFFVGDLNGDGKDDLVIFNGHDWSMSLRRAVPLQAGWSAP